MTIYVVVFLLTSADTNGYLLVLSKSTGSVTAWHIAGGKVNFESLLCSSDLLSISISKRGIDHMYNRVEIIY